MSHSGTSKGKQRVRVTITDAETGEEKLSQELLVLPSYCCWSSCSCTYHPPVVEKAQ